MTLIMLVGLAVGIYYVAPWKWFIAVFAVTPLWGQVVLILCAFVIIVVIGELLIGDQA